MTYLDIVVRVCAGVMTVGALASQSGAVVINVPADQATIQMASGVANPGDEIVIAPGTYSNDAFIGFTANVTVRGATGDPNDVIMDGTNLGPMFLVAAHNITIQDLKFINADNAVFSNFGDNNLITNCIFEGNATNHAQPSAVALEAGTKTVSDCVFINNSSGGAAGAMTIAGSIATITNCQFIGNHCGTGGAGFPPPHGGGAITIAGGVTTIEQCYFEGNSCENAQGGAIRLVDTSGTVYVEECTFVDNSAMLPGGTGAGGAIFVDHLTKMYIDRCGFFNNVATFGGAIACGQSGTPGTEVHITNSVLSGNKAVDGPLITDGFGGGVLLYGAVGDCSVVNCSLANNESLAGGGILDASGQTFVMNNIFAGNTAFDPTGNDVVGVNATYCMFESPVINGTAGVGCLLGVLPNFVDADGVDNVVGTPDDDLHLAHPSAAIDAGTNIAPWIDVNHFDYDGANRFGNDPLTVDTGNGPQPIVDMGAFEIPGCPGDANGDGVIDVNDISMVLFALGNPCAYPGCPGDANYDGVIDVNDISYVLFGLGDPCP